MNYNLTSIKEDKDMFKNVAQVIMVLGIGYAFGYGNGYTKAREKFCEALINVSAKNEKEKVKEEEEAAK